MINRRTLMRVGVGAASLALLGQNVRAATATMVNYHYPEETGAHERTFMQWPVSRTVHPDAYFLADLQKTIATIANSIAQFEPVVMLMDAQYQRGARKLLSEAVDIWDIPTDDLWSRDSGPAFVVDGKGGLAVTQFNFNGWGGKQVHSNDGLIAARVADRLGVPMFNTGLVGEPGGVESDGVGTLIAHESSWINPNRNPGDKASVEALLLQAMGAKKVIWAPGIKGADITDYHIDALARFVAPGRLLIQMGETIDRQDPWSVAAFVTRDILAKATDAAGNALELIVLPEPVDIRVDSPDFVASYVNYYVCNGAVISAQFGDSIADAGAAKLLADLYPGREIVTLNIDPVGEVGGGIHCATHQQPKV